MSYKMRVLLGKVILCVLIVFGLFMAIGSIGSISYLDGMEDSKISAIESFDSSMRRMRGATMAEQLRLRKLDSSMKEMWQQYRAFVISITTTSRELDGSKRKSYLFIADSLNRIILRTVDHLTSNKYIYSNNAVVSIGRLEQLMYTCERKFKNQSSKLPAMLLTEYGEALNGYLDAQPVRKKLIENYNILSSQYNHTFNSLVIADENIKKIGSDLTKGSQATDGDLATVATILPEYRPPILQIETNLSQIAEPTVPTIGQDWGPIFGWFITWIVSPGNLDIVLIVGMIGFALFGSGITIFVTRNLSDRDISISGSITDVLIRGFSAAIIVFLALRGGLAILSTGESKPNPLILYLFCFLGAVFSNSIWQWARSKIQQSFPVTNS